jgi:hypothetical protein
MAALPKLALVVESELQDVKIKAKVKQKTDEPESEEVIHVA